MKRLVIAAHLDDETFGLGGSLSKWSKEDDVRVIILCHGREKQDISSRRIALKAISESEYVNISYEIHDYKDLTLSNHFPGVVKIIQDEIDTFKPEAVYSTSENDLHRDHKIVAEATKLACRPTSKCSVKELYQYYIPASSDWNFSDENFNIVEDISEYIYIKIHLLEFYSSEIKLDETNPGNVKAVQRINAVFGNRFGYEYAEAMRLVYKR